MSCPSDAVLAEWLDGVPTPGEANLRHHVATCPHCLYVVDAARALVEDDSPRRLGRYDLRGTLGAGGMSEVYEAYDTLLQRDVAIKVLRPGSAGDQSTMLHEARLLARVEHRNVVAVFDFGVQGDCVYLAMELVRGSSLADLLIVDPPSLSRRMAIFEDAGRGLAAAHQCGVVHHDFKLGNVLVAPCGDVKVADFGLACEAEVGPTRWLSGTPGYIAPERETGGFDARSDQYSYCAALFRALTGTLPRPDPDAALLRRVPNSRAVRRALGRGLSSDPARRFASMDALLDAFFAAGRRRRRRWRIAGGAALIAAVVIAAGGKSNDGPCAPVAARIEAARAAAGGNAALRRHSEAIGGHLSALCEGGPLREDNLASPCLRERLADLEAASMLAQRGLDASTRLEAPETCSDGRQPTTDRPSGIAARAVALEAELAVAAHLRQTGGSVYVLGEDAAQRNELLLVGLPDLETTRIGMVEHPRPLWELVRLDQNTAASIDREADLLVQIDLRNASVVDVTRLDRDALVNGRGLAEAADGGGVLAIFERQVLYRVQVEHGVSVRLMSLPQLAGGAEAMATCSDGTLYVAGSESGGPRGRTLLRLDSGGDAPRVVGSIGEADVDIDTMTCTRAGLLAADTRGPQRTYLHHVEPQTAGRTLIGLLPTTVNGLLAAER